MKHMKKLHKLMKSGRLHKVIKAGGLDVAEKKFEVSNVNTSLYMIPAITLCSIVILSYIT